jgi:flavin reductase (DIM6/NTAB) family NADH-FMN oxidoreductase RutF
MLAELRTPAITVEEPGADLFRSAMRNLAGGVSVVTAGCGEARSGLTATSVSSLSLEPPSLLVCIRRASATLSAIAAHRAFAVNVLSADRRDLAERFAGQTGLSGADRFGEDDWVSLATGAPLLADALAAVDCAVERMIEWGSHMILIGRVRAIRLGDGPGPLVYWRGSYGQLAPEPCNVAPTDLDYPLLCDPDNY